MNSAPVALLLLLLLLLLLSRVRLLPFSAWILSFIARRRSAAANNCSSSNNNNNNNNNNNHEQDLMSKLNDMPTGPAAITQNHQVAHWLAAVYCRH